MTAFVLQVLRQAATLDHEAGNDAMKDRAIEESFIGIAKEILHRNGCLLIEQLHGERALGGFELKHKEWKRLAVSG